MIGFAVLTAYKAGTYTPGMENDIQVDDKKNAEDFIQSLLANYNQVQGIKAKEEPQLTFAEVYRKFNVKKFGHEYDAKKVKRTSLEYTLRDRIQELCCPTQQNFRKACYRRSAGSNGRLSAQTRQHRTHQKSILPHVQVCYGKQFMYKRLFILCRNHTG